MINLFHFLLVLPALRAGHKVFQHPLLDVHFLHKILITMERTTRYPITGPMLTVCKIGLYIINMSSTLQLYFISTAAWLSIGPIIKMAPLRICYTREALKIISLSLTNHIFILHKFALKLSSECSAKILFLVQLLFSLCSSLAFLSARSPRWRRSRYFTQRKCDTIISLF